MKNITIKKLTKMPYAQAHVEIMEDGTVHLFSYVTLVMTVTPTGWINCTGLYSATTRKHIIAFLKEYCDTVYKDWVQLHHTNYRYNYLTGEVVEEQED